MRLWTATLMTVDNSEPKYLCPRTNVTVAVIAAKTVDDVRASIPHLSVLEGDALEITEGLDMNHPYLQIFSREILERISDAAEFVSGLQLVGYFSIEFRKENTPSVSIRG